MNLWGLFLVAAGLFSVTSAVLDWEWFMNSRKARFMSALLSRNGARIFYVILGAGIIVVGVLIAIGVIQDQPG